MKQIHRRVDWALVITSIVFAVSCSGGGCGGCASMEPIPGGFPAAKRTPNAAQVRVTPTALAKITADPAAVIGPLVGNAMNGKIDFSIPASCGGNPEVCCPGGNPSPTCGPLEIDLAARPGDQPRLALTPVTGQSRLDMTIRARVKTKMALPIRYNTGIIGTISCNVAVDTTRGNTQDLLIAAQIAMPQDPTTGNTRIVAQNVALSQLESADVTLSGGFGCTVADAFIGSFLGTLTDQLEGTISDTINEAVCKTCDSGQLAECGSSFATACTNQTCMVNDRCLQSLGLDGRLRGVNVFGSFSPGTTGALDLYEVAGGYARTDGNGISLGLRGGMLPGGTARDRCGPSATEPAPVTVPESTFFSGNTRPDTNAAFDVGIGLHKSQLGQFAYAGYEGGLLCLTVGASTVEQLSTDTLALLSRSLGNLVETNSPMAVGLRPQSPPTIVLGKNRFMDDGQGGQTLTEPLLDLQFQALEIDFFASVDDHWIRVFTVVSDVRLPIGLQTAGLSEIVPVIGDTDMAFTNVSVKNTEAITESPAELASLFPQILALVLPQLSGGLGGFELPAIGGLSLQVADITSVDNDNFLAIYANLVTSMPAREVDTNVTLANVAEPATTVARDPQQWKSNRAPSVTLDLGSVSGLEWSYKVDGGSWSPWSTNRRPTISRGVFWLPGLHTIEVRAREIGKPATMDRSPEKIEVLFGTDVALGNGKPVTTIARADNGFHGQAGSSGCGGCETGGDLGGGAPIGLALFALLVPMRRTRRATRSLVRGVSRLGPIVWLAALLSLQGCSCGSDNPCGDAECLPGEVANGGHGRYTSVAADDTRVLVATYDQGLGDLVVIDATDDANRKLVVVDGVPDVTPTYDPGTYRGGIEDAGEDVGTWTSIALNRGLAVVAYQDRENASLKVAYETKAGTWGAPYTLDDGDEDIGSHANVIIDASGHAAIAYHAIGVDDGQGHRVTELRIARASEAVPDSEADWTTHVAARAEGTCGGLCGGGTVCAVGTPETCVTATTDCAGTCGDGTACVSGACVDIVGAPTVAQLASGTGLFAQLVVMPDGRLGAVYYNRSAHALQLALESTAGANDFVVSTIDATTPGDRGMWASAVVDGTGTIHIAYQDALGDQLLYTTWNGSPGTPEVVDDGQRPGDRTHNVGASASIYLVHGAPAIAYQDGMNADVYVATRSGTSWTTTGVAVGPLLDGFSIGAALHGGSPVLAWGALDPAASPLGSVVVRAP